MDNFVGMKELYDVTIRLNQPLVIGKKKYDINESILSLKTAEIAQISQIKRDIQARGGYNNPALINWEVDREIQFGITHGVLSPKSWALLSNSKVKEPQIKSVQYNETQKIIEDQGYCYVDLKFIPNSCECIIGAQPNPCNEPLPMGRRPELLLKPLPPSKTKWIFVYDIETGQRIRDFEVYANRIFFKSAYREVYVDYTFDYNDGIKVVEIGNRLINGFVRLDGKISIKDEKTGEVKTAILEIPKVKLSSSLNIRLGKNYDNSTVSDFYFTGYPLENRENQKIANVIFLDKELTGEYI